MMPRIGVIDGGGARVEPDGRVRPDGSEWQLGWWIGADDRWRMPGREPAVRQTQIGDVPVVQTAMRVPGGDALHRVYGAGPGLVVVEIENASPAPFVVAFVVHGARDVAVDGLAVRVDGEPALITPRAPSRWAAAVDGTTFEQVTGGDASIEPFPGARDRRRGLEVAFAAPGGPPYDPARRPDTGAPHAGRRRGRDRRRGARAPECRRGREGWSPTSTGACVPRSDERLTGRPRRPGVRLLLHAGAGAVTADVVAALEDWGFDAEAATAWQELPGRQRRRASRRTAEPATWTEVDRARGLRDGPALLLALRSLLVHDRDDGTVTVCTDLPVAWRGHGLEVHDAPTRRGPVSFAVRWHGPRPALLWDVPPGSELRAPGLDLTWSTTEPRGEALLSPAAVPA